MASTISAGTTSGTALNFSGDTTGNLAFTTQAGVNTITVPNVTGTIALTSQLPVAGPAFAAYPASNQSISSGSFTKITCDTELFDTNSNFASSRFTPTVAGYYQLNLNLNLGFAVITRTISALYKNGSLYTYGADFNGSSMATCSATYLVYANGTTDYFEMYTLLVGTSLLSVGGANGTNFSGTLVRSA